MSENKAKLSDSLKKNVTPKNFKKNPIKGTKFTIMVSSAKGGVGKSTFAINLTFALQKKGKKVGLLDADIHGPSLPKMIGLNDKPKTDGKFLFPIEKYGAQFMSLGFLVDEKTPMIWRGPMVISAIKTLTEKVSWKDLDFSIFLLSRYSNIEFAKSSTEERRGPSLFPCPGKSIERTPLFFLRKCLVGKVQTV